MDSQNNNPNNNHPTTTQTPTQTTQTTTQTPNQTPSQNNPNPSVDVEKIKSDATAAYLKSLGVESDEALKEILKKQKEAEDASKTDLQKANDTLTETTRQLSEERKARMMAEAKLSAIKLGAKPELVDDLVTVAMARVTKEKDISAIISEIKEGANGKIYFVSGDDEEEQKKKNKNVTRKTTPTTKPEGTTGNTQQTQKYAGTFAERMAQRKKETKPHFFK